MANSLTSSYESKENMNEKLRKKLEEIKSFFLKTKEEYWIDYVFSKELENIDFDKIEAILIGDNPWEKEFKNNEFFSSEWKAWKMARDLFKVIYWDECFQKNVLILNKTLFHTNRTHQLKKWSEIELLKESQILLADFLIDFLNEKKVPVVIVWFAEMNWFFKEYFSILKEKWKDAQLLKYISVTPHFSLSKIFCKNWNEHWNNLNENFLEKYPYLKTPNWNISSKAFYVLQDKKIFEDFFQNVILKQNILCY